MRAAPASRHWLMAALAAVLLWSVPASADAQTAAVLYQRAQTQEASARKSGTLSALRSAATAYENVVRRHPRSGYCDDALWYGAELARYTWEKHGQAADKATAERLYTWLRKEYPTSSKVKSAITHINALNAPARPAPTKPAPAAAAPPAAATPPPAAPAPTPTPAAPAVATPTGPTAALKAVTLTPLPKGDRLTLEFDREVLFTAERLAGPDRVFFDLEQADYQAATQALAEALQGTRVQAVRLGRQDGAKARVVLELAGSPTHSAFVLYHPFRLVVDVESDVAPVAPSGPPPPPTPTTPPPAPPAPVAAPVVGPSGPAPSIAPASTTSGGDYGLARQLGLGVSRVVIDPGHGGHDPGAKANGVEEAELVLDVALRVEALLQKAGVDVVLTRRTDEFIPLEERTAIANREGADLFLSIHANAARRTTARGVETYFLNFATNPEAEAVAARENATSAGSMGSLPKLVQQITLNAKVKESREFAQIVQTSMIRGLRQVNKTVQDLGVKQAPFVVLIGAQMPSVLAEISFVTNKSEATLLKRDAYKQKIAQSLADSILKYQASLKKSTGLVATAK
ncbi:MAG: hypothetical protein AMXMBFR57_32960 [Acidimicrobiia bacterium]